MINTPFNYTGSKFKLLSQILPHFDYSKSYFIDLFTGGGSVYTNVVDKYQKILCNDVIKDLVDIHKELLFNKDKFIEKVKSLCVSKTDKEGFHLLRLSYNLDKSPEKLFALMLCCTNNMMRFNKSFLFNSTFGERTFNNSTQKKVDEFCAGLENYKSKIEFKSESFENIWPDNPRDTFWFLDPPYNSKINNGAGYNHMWKDRQDEALFDKIIKIDESGGTFALSSVFDQNKSLNSLLVNRLLEYEFRLIKLDFNYKNVARNKAKHIMTEILITNVK